MKMKVINSGSRRANFAQLHFVLCDNVKAEDQSYILTCKEWHRGTESEGRLCEASEWQESRESNADRYFLDFAKNHGRVVICARLGGFFG